MKKEAWQDVTSGRIWQPEEGEQLDGYIGERFLIPTKYGEKPHIEIAVKETGELHIVNTARKNLRVLNRIPVGTRVLLTFIGTTKVKGKKIMVDNFRVQTYGKVKLVDDWTEGKYYGFEGKRHKPVRHKKSRRRKR